MEGVSMIFMELKDSIGINVDGILSKSVSLAYLYNVIQLHCDFVL